MSVKMFCEYGSSSYILPRSQIIYGCKSWHQILMDCEDLQFYRPAKSSLSKTVCENSSYSDVNYGLS